MFKNIFPKLGRGSKHRQKYAEYLIYRHRNFDVKGLTTQGVYTLELAQVFVELGLGEQSADQASADPLRPNSHSFRQKRTTVWNYLVSDKLATQPLVILGSPGSGKTTLLKHLTISLAPQKMDTAVTLGYKRLPIMLALRDYAEAINSQPQFSIIDALRTTLNSWDDIDIPNSWFEEQLKKGQCLIMLDGLDEVADGQLRQRVVVWVDRQIEAYANNQFVITSRPFGYRSNPLRKGLILETQPFNIKQVARFVHNWYFANEIMSSNRNDPGVKMEAKRGAEDLLFRLRRAHVLLDMAVNPLLLTMIATVHRYRSSLPGRRVELYAEICEVFLGKRQQARGIMFDLTPAQKRRVLQPLAYAMMRGKQREIRMDDAAAVIRTPLLRVSPDMSGELFLEMIANSSGLLVEREMGIYSFAHLTFQEYLTAVHVQDRRIEAELITRVEDSWWHETIRLYAARGDASKIVHACLSRPKPSIQALTLTMECLEEAREIQPELRDIIEKLVQSVDHPKQEVRRISAEVQLLMRLRRMMRVDEDRYIDTTFVTHAEYQLFLDDRRRSDTYHQPDHWAGYMFKLGRGRTPIVGARPLDAVAFCEWMTERDPGGWQYRLPKSNEVSIMAANRETMVSHPLSLGYWFVTAKGILCSKFDLPDAAQVQTFLRQIKGHFYIDWKANPQLKHHSAALDLLITRAQHRQFTLLDMDRNLKLDRLMLPDIVHDVNQIRDRRIISHVNILAEQIQYDLALAQDPNPERARRLTLNEALALSKHVRDELAHAQNIGSVPKLARTLYHHLEQAHVHAQTGGTGLPTQLLRTLISTHNYADELVRTLNQARQETRRRVRVNSVGHIDGLLQKLEAVQATGQTQVRDELRQLLSIYVDLYIDFVLLEDRIGKKTTSFEGIRIVKERKSPTSAD